MIYCDTELHAVWNTNIINKYNNNILSFLQELQKLIQTNQTLIPLYTHTMNPVDWANESFDYVRDLVYTEVSGSM